MSTGKLFTLIVLVVFGGAQRSLSAPDLTGYTLVFDEEFDGPLSVSAYGPGTKWVAHTTGLHTYGALINADYIHFYFDGEEQWVTPTPPEAKEPLYIMVDLALGGGWPIDQTPNPSKLYVDYIRVYAPPGGASSNPAAVR